MAEIASGSIDLKTVKNAHDDATKYITKIDDAGISIHPYNDSTGTSITKNRAVVTSDGMEIYKNNVSVASFGTVARIGSMANGFTRTEITSRGMQIFYNNSGADEYIATFGYGNGNSASGTAIYAPYYTLGSRGTTTTPYDSDSTYEVGDLCIYDDKEWVCITAIDTAEAWDATHWMRSIGNYSHAEGWNTVASGHSAHAEGRNAIAIGNYSHAEGFHTIAIGFQSHAEGSESTAIGFQSHAEGYDTVASGDYSHAEGIWSVASGDRSHAQNYMTIAASDSQTAIGKYNVEDATDTYAFIVGKGTPTVRSNAFTVSWTGDVQYAGTISKMSDKKLKNHISYLNKDAVEFIRKLKPVYYSKDEDVHLGFYAQDVEEIDTWKVFVREMNGYKTLKYDDFIAPLTTYCQHLEIEIEQLKKEIQELKNK